MRSPTGAIRRGRSGSTRPGWPEPGPLGLFGDRIRDGVRAEAEVLALSPSAKAARQEGRRDVEYELRLRVSAADGAPLEVDHTARVPAAKLPFPGQRLPVTVSASDPTRLRIEWNEAPDAAERARASAEAAGRGDVAGAAEALGFTLRDQDRP